MLFSAAYRPRNDLLKLWSLPDIKLLTSIYAVEEARRNLTSARQLEVLRRLTQTLSVLDELPTTDLPKRVALPDKDAPILRAAIQAKATYLLTGDRKHFGAYYGHMLNGALIVPPRAYFCGRATPFIDL